MLPASPAIAGARRAPDTLHLLLTVISRRACFLGFARPQLFRAMPTPLQCNPGTRHQVERAGIASLTQGHAHGVLWSCKSSCVSVEFYAQTRAATLCKPVMGVARADGLYGDG